MRCELPYDIQSKTSREDWIACNDGSLVSDKLVKMLQDRMACKHPEQIKMINYELKSVC